MELRTPSLVEGVQNGVVTEQFCLRISRIIGFFKAHVSKMNNGGESIIYQGLLTSGFATN